MTTGIEQTIMSEESTFVERATERLNAEHNSQPQPDESSPEVETQEEDTTERQSDEETVEEPEGHTEAEDSEEADQDGESDEDKSDETEGEWTAREKELRAEVEQARESAAKAEELRQSMEKDYRRKTQALSQNRKELEDEGRNIQATAEYFVALADQGLRRFDGINWAEVRTDPETYEQYKSAYTQAATEAENRRAELKQIMERREKMEEENRKAIANHSRGILEYQIPEWREKGEDIYRELRTFAEENYDYPAEEFDALVDWRPMKMLYDAMSGQRLKKDAAQTIRKVKVKQGAKKKAQRNTTLPERNEMGQFRKAHDDAFSSPGNRETFREMKARQLALERKRR